MNRLVSTTIALCVLSAACRSHQASGTAESPAPVMTTQPAISPADLERRLYLIADDSMMGRETGSEGAFKASPAGWVSSRRATRARTSKPSRSGPSPSIRNRAW